MYYVFKKCRPICQKGYKIKYTLSCPHNEVYSQSPYSHRRGTLMGNSQIDYNPLLTLSLSSPVLLLERLRVASTFTENTREI